MKDNKVERFRQSAAMLRWQFLQGDAGIFDQALGDQEVAVGNNWGQTTDFQSNPI